MSEKNKTWVEFRGRVFNATENAEIDLEAAIICELIAARREKGLTQRDLESLSGVKQPVIARMERGSSNPNLATVVKLLAPLGKTLAVVDAKRP